jgi:hypothetical protein
MRRAESAGEALAAGRDQLTIGAAIVEAPTVGNRQPGRVTMAQVVAVRIAFGREVVEPDERATVLVRERGVGGCCATGP